MEIMKYALENIFNLKVLSNEKIKKYIAISLEHGFSYSF
jgi:hypothetical protein